jgi:hypothetical protein
MAIDNKDDLVAKERALDELEHASSSSNEDAFDKKMAARIRHRVDWRLIPALGAMYGIALMDRKNVSNAAIAGMLTDLKLTSGPGYNVVNMCFFITYILLQPAMIIVCRKTGPRFFLPAVCLAWGAVVIGFGFTQTWPALIPLRLLLGALEAGYFPGCLYLLSCWYTRFEVARRYSVFYLIGSIASALSGILAYALQQMEGVNGIRGWRWIFIMEGVITCAVAIFSYAFLIKFPDEEKAKPSWGFLNPEETDFLIARLNAERGDVEPEKFTWKRFLQPATEWYIYGFPFILLYVPSSPLHCFTPCDQHTDPTQPRHDHRLRLRLHPTHHPAHEPRLQHGHVTMPGRAPLRLLRHHHVPGRLVQRQAQDARPRAVLPVPCLAHRPADHGVREESLGAVLWRFCDGGRDEQCDSERDGVSGE